MSASLVGIFPPQDLCRSVGLGLQRIAAGIGNVGETMPRFGDINLGCDYAIEDNSSDFVVADRFNRDTDSAGMIIFGWLGRFNRRVANEASQFDGAGFGIGDRRFKTDDATDRDDRTRFVVDSNSRCVSGVRSRASTAGQSIAMRRIGRRQQSVVFDRRDVETVTGSNASCQL